MAQKAEDWNEARERARFMEIRFMRMVAQSLPMWLRFAPQPEFCSATLPYAETGDSSKTSLLSTNTG